MNGLTYELGKLEKEIIPRESKRAIKDFVDDLTLEGISEIRRKNYIQRLRVVARWIPDSFLTPGKEDIRKVFLNLSGNFERTFRGTHEKVTKHYSEYTKATYLDMMKRFYRWRFGEEESKRLLGNIKIDKKKLPHKVPEDMITQNEIDLLTKNCRNSRDRALFATLYDSGCRIGELMLMKIENLSFDDYGAILRVPWEGKTGFRNVRIVGNSIVYLKTWLAEHPRIEDKQAPLFCNVNKKPGKRLDHQQIYSIIDRTLRRASIKKRIHPHLFRHTRATILASKPLAGSVFEDQMGWIHGSKQTQTYVHLGGKQQDIAILKAYGINVEEDSGSEARPKTCPRCGELNAYNAAICKKCWIPLTTEEILRAKEEQSRVTKALKESDLISDDAKDLLDPDNLKGLAKMLIKIEKNGQLDKLIELARQKEDH